MNFNGEFMEKIIHPRKGMEGYNCFGCAPHTEAGVKMEFYEDGDEVISIFFGCEVEQEEIIPLI